MKKILLLFFLFTYSEKIFSQQLFTVYDTATTPLQVMRVNCLTKEGSTLWAGSEYGIVSFNGSNWNFYLFNNQSQSFLNNILSVAVDASGNKWFGTSGGGLGKFDGTNWTILNVANSPLPSDIVSAITIDAQNKMWLGTTAGVAVWDMDTTWIIYQQFSSALMSDHIECIVEGENDTMWIGTQNGGLTRAVDTSWLTYTISNAGVPDNTIFDFENGNNGLRYLGCAAHGLALFQYSSPPYAELNPSNSEMPSYTVRSLAVDTAGFILCGTYGGGLVRHFGGTMFQIFNDSTVSLPDSMINDILVDTTGVIWLATVNNGIIRFDEPLLYAGISSTVFSEFDIQIFPNPAIDFIDLKLKASLTEKELLVEIFDVAGRRIKSELIPEKYFSGKVRMNISDFENGIYMICFSDEKNSVTAKFLKM